MARTAAFARQVDAFALELQGTRTEIMVQAANLAFADAQTQNRAVLGHEPAYRQFVDGREGAPLESVKPGGKIVYLFDVGTATLTQAVDAAFEIYLGLAPRGGAKDPHSGLYADSLMLLVNGEQRAAWREVNATAAGAIAFAQTDVVSLVNLLPYARRIEQGWSAQAPNGVLEVTYAALRSRYGNLLNLSFRYEGYPGAGPKGPRSRRGGVRTRRGDDAFPTITMSLK